MKKRLHRVFKGLFGFWPLFVVIARIFATHKMSKHTHRPSNETQPKPDNRHNEKEVINRDVYIKTPVTIEAVDDFIHEYGAAQKSNKRQLRWSVLMAWATVAGTLAIAYQSCLTRDALRLTREQFTAEQRPWVGFADGESKTLKFTDQRVLGTDKPTMLIKLPDVHIHNFGKSPAQRVYASFTIKFPGHIPKYQWRSDPNTCKDALDATKNLNDRASLSTVFPSSELVRDFEAGGEGPIGTAYIIGCISYQGQDNDIYQTVTVYRQRNSPNPPMGTSESTPNVVYRRAEWFEQIDSYAK